MYGIETLHIIAFAMVAAGGTAVVLIREPRRQAVMFGIYGMILTLFFMILQAPDVALSELAVGSAAMPLMLLVTLARIRIDRRIK
ncbi:MAG TPA: DUF4040 domain-containing protein [Candidatus Binataceae bacterium]|jgi:energy-converting hydrogenase B subunit D|nr:DUF4040 domain-containing protein [Candidatus Binataceae bacterium]